MQLKSLELVNFCQHRSLNFDYYPGVTGVLGPNGSGKSNFLDVGQFFAITGEVSIGTKKDLLNWNAKQGFTRLAFAHDGADHILQRNLHNSGVSLLRNGEKFKEGAEANAYMTEILHMPPALLYETCFVAQGNLWEVLVMTHQKRLEYFQRLTATMEAEVIRGILQAAIASLPVYPDRSAERERLGAEIKTKTAYKVKLEGDHDRLADLKAKYDEKLAEAKRLAALPTTEEMLQKVEAVEEALKQAKEERLQYQLDNALVAPAFSTVIKPEQRELARRHLSLKQARERLAAADTALTFVDAELGRLVTYKKEDLDALQKELNDAKARRKELTEELDLARQGKCPRCHQPVKHIDVTAAGKELESVNLRLPVLEKRYTEADTQYHKYIRDSASLKSRQKAEQEERAKQEVVIKGLKDVESFDEAAFARLEKEAAEYSAYLQKRKEHEDAVARLEKAVVIQEAEIAALKKVAVTIDAKAKEEATAFLVNHEELATALATADTNIKLNQGEIDGLNKRIHDFDVEDAKTAKIKKLIRLFEDARAELHREKLPKLVMSYLLARLNALLSRYLELFQLPFRAMISDDFDFLADFASKEGVPAARLSGGQKVALSIAFRLALTDLLAGSVPLVVLDEPTNHLDAVNREQVREVIASIRKIASRGTAFLVATHDPVLIPACNRTVELTGK